MKYGFVYIWFDRRHKRYYLGRHWGRIDDGYICSSNKMRDAYRRRPTDFKRRIIIKVANEQSLIEQEQRFLNMIKPSECGQRYYNVTLRATMPSMRGRKHSEETKQKMRLAAVGKPKSEEHKEKLRQINTGKKHTEETKKKMSESHLISGRVYDDKFRQAISFAGKNRSIETRQKIRENNKRLHAEKRIGTYKDRSL